MANEDLNERDARTLQKAMQGASDLFDRLCQTRHSEGAKEYGPVSFLENDVIRMLCEELADTANYARMQFIKLMLLQTTLEDDLADKTNSEGNIVIGAKSFRGTGKMGWLE